VKENHVCTKVHVAREFSLKGLDPTRTIAIAIYVNANGVHQPHRWRSGASTTGEDNDMQQVKRDNDYGWMMMW
jgi:hypothetical protein